LLVGREKRGGLRGRLNGQKGISGSFVQVKVEFKGIAVGIEATSPPSPKGKAKPGKKSDFRSYFLPSFAPLWAAD